MAKKDKKIAVLLLSLIFMVEHSRAGQPTGFKEKLESGEKLHTMRGNYNYWAGKAAKINAGEMVLSIRHWRGKPFDSTQCVIKTFQHLNIQRYEGYWYKEQRAKGELPTFLIDGKLYEDVAQLAKNDGLSLEDWLEWFFKKTETVEGAILHFTQDFKY
jgi:hypothetical protein